MEVELSILESEVSDRARWHEAAFYIACFGVFADEYVAFVGELGPESFLLVFLIGTECFADVDRLQLSVGLFLQ